MLADEHVPISYGTVDYLWEHMDTKNDNKVNTAEFKNYVESLHGATEVERKHFVLWHILGSVSVWRLLMGVVACVLNIGGLTLWWVHDSDFGNALNTLAKVLFTLRGGGPSVHWMKAEFSRLVFTELAELTLDDVLSDLEDTAVPSTPVQKMI